MEKKFLLIIMTSLLIATVTGQATTPKPATTAADNFAKAWRMDTSKWSFDPTAWDTTMTSRMYMVGVGAFFAAYTSLTMPLVLGFAVFLFGLVKLNWPLVVTSCLALHGWKNHHRVMLAVGVAATYGLSFGFSMG